MSSHTLGKFECIVSKHLDELDSYSFSGNKPEKHMTSTCSLCTYALAKKSLWTHFNQLFSILSLLITTIIFTVDGWVLSHEDKLNKTNYWW